MEEADGLTWIVRKRPEEQLRTGQWVRLCTEEQVSGTGKIGHITALKRHWITLTITGATHRIYLRAPTAWVALGDLEAVTHTKHYFALPSYPRPHPLFRTPLVEDAQTNPYEFDLADPNVTRIESRIRRITGGTRGDAEREGRGENDG
ncbi:hypothetical protein FOMPIDRAFT_1048017 [Fomitopsis schrenkii]|uniref:Uncharacterized protein n=1 Tax=Fomitopsis schrenkii TaxID=2126942 RepID=S8FLU5_FOMSC|nr:hypothetical protein FOMPIDRAFT_1048017 [Fomitopsis schrenkii]